MATEEVDEEKIAALVKEASECGNVTRSELLKACSDLLGELKRYREGTVYAGCEELSCGAKNEFILGDLMDQLDY